MQNANRTWWRTTVLLSFAFCLLHFGAVASAQPAAPIVTELIIEQEGRPVVDEQISSLIETTVGSPLAVRDVRESIAHLASLDRFDDVRVVREDVPQGVRLRYVLVPSHPVDRVQFRGMVSLPEDDLRAAIRDRFGVDVPPARRADEVAMALRSTFQSRGFPNATITPRIEEFHNPDRATLFFDIQSGPRVLISRVNIEQADETPRNVVVGAPAVRAGQPYDADRIDRELTRYVNAMRERGFFEAYASHSVEFTPQGADVTLLVNRGPHVTIAFTGDPIPSGERDRLVPIRTEASVSQDLLEDSQNAIARYFHERGYRDAQVDYTPVEQAGELTITFNVVKGPRYVVERVTVAGNTAIPSAELIEAMRVDRGDPFVQSAVDARGAAIVGMYRDRGYTRSQVRVTTIALPETESDAVERRVEVAVSIAEGPRTVIRSVTLKGNSAIPETELRPLLVSVVGKPYSELEVVNDRDRLELEYRNRGYESVLVTPAADLADGDTQADITFSISEGQRIYIDHVIIVGNRRTSASTIERELVLMPGQPLGSAAVIESQQRLVALGLFRVVRITDIKRGGNPLRDVVVRVEEAPVNSHAFGAGLEVGSFIGSSDVGTAEERYEFVPRGSFEIGRRNMGGKNRSINLFTRVALRSRDLVVTDDGLALDEQTGAQGFNEYRIFTTYREPRVFNTRADLLITGLVDQARRSSFNFNRREVRAEIGMRVSPKYSVAGRYSLERTRLFDERYSEEEKPVIDRLFPRVRLSKISGTVIREGRQDLLNPVGGSLLSFTGDLALRGMGSEVGFAKTYLEAFAYPQLPFGPRPVLALGGRLGLAQGFERQLDNDSVEDLPASERFFSGGDTTVRGFSLDRLGTNQTITVSGFPTGGNAVVILNAELRIPLTSALQVVTFVDVGNVFAKVEDLDMTDLRPSYGVGSRIKLPLLSAPIRVDIGVNPDRRELVPGTLERAFVLHISLGQAF